MPVSRTRLPLSCFFPMKPLRAAFSLKEAGQFLGGDSRVPLFVVADATTSEGSAQ